MVLWVLVGTDGGPLASTPGQAQAGRALAPTARRSRTDKGANGVDQHHNHNRNRNRDQQIRRPPPPPSLDNVGHQRHVGQAHMHHGPRGAITQRRLYCQTQYFLQIGATGKVNGTKDRSSKYGVFNFIDMGTGKVYIQGVYTARYLCMNHLGQLYGSMKKSGECIFSNGYENRYNTYYSFKNSTNRKKWYVALSKRGKPRLGYKSRRRQKSVRFLVTTPY